MAINERASSDARHARTGKDAGLYDGDGTLLASMETFASKATYNNVKYRPLGDPQEHETSDSYGITITVTEIVIEDIDMFKTLMESMKTGVTPQFVFQGVLIGLNGSEERVVYRECIPSGDIDLQNVANGDVIKRNWSFFVNGKPEENIEEEVREETFSAEETKNQLRVKEDDFIAGMLSAAAYKSEEVSQIDIVRGGKLFFSFRIHALGEEEANKSRKKHTKYVRNKQIGVKFAEETDNAKFRSSLIYHATVEEDRNKLWDNKQVWNGLIAQGHQIVTALDVIEAVLLGGEKDRIIDEINKMSGFNSENIEEVENNLEDVTKN